MLQDTTIIRKIICNAFRDQEYSQKPFNEVLPVTLMASYHFYAHWTRELDGNEGYKQAPNPKAYQDVIYDYLDGFIERLPDRVEYWVNKYYKDSKEATAAEMKKAAPLIEPILCEYRYERLKYNIKITSKKRQKKVKDKV